MTHHYRSDFLTTLNERGFIDQCTDPEALDGRLARVGIVTGYIGFDCTADSLHVGSLVPIMMLRWLQNTGHKPIVLMGGGTTKIGDPSGKDESRQLLSDDQIAANMAGIRQVFTRFLKFGDGPTDAVIVNNADWLDRLAYIPFLREVGPHFTINRMLSFESVKLRLERKQPLTFLEFNYMILQAYDFLELHRRNRCVLQMGGSDQWGNIINGIELGRRLDQAALFGLTTTLMTTASGAKMGKTAAGAVWLNADRLSPYDYWQYWRNTEDADVGRFLALFTELPLDEVARLAALEGAGINEAKKVLAFQATKLAHGIDAAIAAAETARLTFEDGAAAEGLPTTQLPAGEWNPVSLFVKSGLAASGGEARRLIRGGGARIDDVVVIEENRGSKYEIGAIVKLTAGKKRHAIVQIIQIF